MPPFDAIVIGTGFAGAVTACRLTQTGQKICVLERGRRYGPHDFPTFPLLEEAESRDDSAGYEPSYDFSRWFWNIGDGHGLWDVRDLNGVVTGQAAGYGGGSLIYANVHLRAPKEVFDRTSTKPGNHLWPAEYRRDTLDKYYDRAAYMLNVKPVHPSLNLPKTKQMKRAAKTLQDKYKGAWEHSSSRQEYKFRFEHFSPPLAINDYLIPGTSNADGRQEESANDENQLNTWNRNQKPCDLGGYCWMGCRRQAKNTLDLNYLAMAEDAMSKDESPKPLADIRTLAEVTTIRHGENGGYEVTYADHLENGKKVTITGKYVFLCAGTTNTTELLLLNHKKENPDHDSEKGNLGVKGLLGDRYYPNGDSLAAVYDCDQTQNAQIGPTITSAMLYDDGKDWFLIQDGGFPANLEPLFGLFRSPLWTRRNRFLESAPPSSQDPSSRDWTEHHRNLRKTRPAVKIQLPFGTVEDTVRKLPGESTTLMPDQLKEALDNDREELLDHIGKLSEERVRKLFDEIAEQLDNRLDDVVDSLPAGTQSKFQDIAQFGVSRGMLRLVAQIMWGSESELARDVADQLWKELPTDRASIVKTAMAILRWALDYRVSNDRMAMLLTMGKDQEPGELYLDKRLGSDRHRSSLRAKMPGPLMDTARITQERAFRDIASEAWHGELRTNPVWSFMRRRFTVHGQGGCAMGDQAGCVTAATGEVHGCPGLYVMDAAAFPTPVGVNPSATIAAVAEYKIKEFIKDVLKIKDWEADLDKKVEEWLRKEPYGDGKTHAELLDPIPTGRTIPRDIAPLADVVGLTFNETMVGFHDGKSAEPDSCSTIWHKPDEEFTKEKIVDEIEWDKLAEPYRTAQQNGLKSSSCIEAKLKVCIKDLMRFLECYAAVEGDYGNRNSSSYLTKDIVKYSKISVKGCLEIVDFPDLETPGNFEVKEGSYLWLFPNATAGKEIADSFMKYRLLFDAKIKEETVEYELNGIKILQDKSGLDMWEDTATLYFEICRVKDREKCLSGILRLPAEELLMGQLRTFKATGTTDPARQSWALGGFAKFFAGHLAQIYVPEQDRLQQVLKNIVTRTHG